jgi:hypothetical protein
MLIIDGDRYLGFADVLDAKSFAIKYFKLRYFF